MSAWVVERPARSTRTRWVSPRASARARSGRGATDVRACGVCRTDLHLAEGDLAPRRPRVTRATRWSPRSKASGRARRGARRRPGGRGVAGGAPAGGAATAPPAARTSAWRRPSPAGTSTAATPTTWSRREEYLYDIPDAFDDLQAAPLLCAGIIGFRALRLSCPPGGRLGIYGSAGRPTSPPRSHWPKARRCTC